MRENEALNPREPAGAFRRKKPLLQSSNSFAADPEILSESENPFTTQPEGLPFSITAGHSPMETSASPTIWFFPATFPPTTHSCIAAIHRTPLVRSRTSFRQLTFYSARRGEISGDLDSEDTSRLPAGRKPTLPAINTTPLSDSRPSSAAQAPRTRKIGGSPLEAGPGADPA